MVVSILWVGARGGDKATATGAWRSILWVGARGRVLRSLAGVGADAGVAPASMRHPTE
ncbi:hypothetical protein [Gulosibacter hominis]|uniref:hypothetical protein n=1 Tax=Gulosibacter hominis TaxID=2770504 RepID=UPI001919D409|nr:hypothetical protein [Gulosibacter hominis]